MTDDFAKMVTHYALPPYVETYLITDNDVVEQNVYTINQETGERIHSHPEYEKFVWTTDPVNNLLKLHQDVFQQTIAGKKSVIAIFEDHTIKYKLNVDKDFKPTLALKNQ